MDRFLDHERTRLRYRDEGAGSTLVLVHGWALDLDMWQPQVDALVKHYRLVRMDRRGFGESRGTPSIEADARDILDLMDRLLIDRAVIVGMSQGARVAVMLADRAPGRISGLVLDGAPALDDILEIESEEKIPIPHYRALLGSEGIDALRKELASHSFMQLQTSNPDRRRLLRSILGKYPATDLLKQVGTAPPAVNLGRLDVPALVLNGSHDTQHRRHVGNALARLLPSAQRVLVEGSGHLPNLDNADSYNALLRCFVEQHAPGMSGEPQ